MHRILQALNGDNERRRLPNYIRIKRRRRRRNFSWLGYISDFNVRRHMKDVLFWMAILSILSHMGMCWPQFARPPGMSRDHIRASLYLAFPTHFLLISASIVVIFITSTHRSRTNGTPSLASAFRERINMFLQLTHILVLLVDLDVLSNLYDIPEHFSILVLAVATWLHGVMVTHRRYFLLDETRDHLRLEPFRYNGVDVYCRVQHALEVDSEKDSTLWFGLLTILSHLAACWVEIDGPPSTDSGIRLAYAFTLGCSAIIPILTVLHLLRTPHIAPLPHAILEYIELFLSASHIVGIYFDCVTVFGAPFPFQSFIDHAEAIHLPLLLLAASGFNLVVKLGCRRLFLVDEGGFNRRLEVVAYDDEDVYCRSIKL